MTRLYIVIGVFLLACAGGGAIAGPFEYEFEELAPGIWAGVRPDSSRFPVMGNTTIVIGDEGVVVFDGGGVPVMAEQVIDKVRSITDVPVTCPYQKLDSDVLMVQSAQMFNRIDCAISVNSSLNWRILLQ